MRNLNKAAMRQLKLHVSLLFGALAICAAWPVPRSIVTAEQVVQFNRDIRPLLSDRCFYCHGPDEKNRQAGLRLDTFEGATKDRGGYQAIAPGKPDESELIKRVTAHDASEVMPPLRAKKPAITPQEAELLRRWIAQGAKYEGHWAFQPLNPVAPPPVKNQKWVRNEIDQFIIARLEREGITPSPEADPRTLIRRLSLDLTGLLPSPEEVAAFVKASARDREAAYRGLVDRLLASPHYGERWGRHWLDQARYADSNGYTIDGDRVMWPYRDWVIGALNQDLPFDRFTVEQLAGDLLPKPTKAQMVATGFHRNTFINEEGGVDREQARVEQVLDRTNTTGAVWLGLTVGCAQCHTHKFDPIPHKEYYQFFAFFNSSVDANNIGPTVRVKRGELFGKIERDDAASEREFTPETWERMEITRLEASSTATSTSSSVNWVPLNVINFDTEANGTLKTLDDRSLLVTAPASGNDADRVAGRISNPRVGAVRLRVLPHESLPQNGPGLAENGNFVLTEFIGETEGTQPRFTEAFADQELSGYSARTAIDRDSRTGWSLNIAGDESKSGAKAPHEVIFAFAKPKEFASLNLQFNLKHDANAGAIGRFTIEVASEIPRDEKAAALLAALKTPTASRNPQQQALISAAFASARATREMTAGNSAAAMVMNEIAQPRPTFILTRGDFTRPDKSVGQLRPGVLSAVAPTLPTSNKQLTRLDLANWLFNPANPLTSRVAINRMWMRYFGRGIVETEEDFGTQGTPPTHPELLDWLAGEFMKRGWSLKAMHRLIVTSATYRQSSDARKDLSETDPRNLLLARQERLRVEAEIVRDASLCASGLLDARIGGPSVRPPQPDGVYAFTQVKKNWMAASGGDRFRRALYTVFYRSAPYPLFTTFDAPDFQTVCTRRPRSNTPLQSLTMANDPAFLEIAQGLALRLVRDVPGDFSRALEGRLRRAFVLCYSREPASSELAMIRGYAERQLRGFTSEPAGTAALVNEELKKAGLNKAQSAALVAVARVLFNTDNFITRE
jgi:hypothetical protein